MRIEVPHQGVACRIDDTYFTMKAIDPTRAMIKRLILIEIQSSFLPGLFAVLMILLADLKKDAIPNSGSSYPMVERFNLVGGSPHCLGLRPLNPELLEA